MDRRGLKGAPRKSLIDLDDVVYGIHAVNEALLGGEELLHVHVGDERRRDRTLQPLFDAARGRGIPIRFETRTFFGQFPYKAHQNVVAVGKPFAYAALAEITARAPVDELLLVALDHLTDPHNVGAIIRTAESAGAHGVILPDRRAAGINATVRKAAAGATAHVPIAQVTNLASALRDLKGHGVWAIGAATGAGTAPYTAVDFKKGVVLVIGAEGAGLSELIRKQCDELAAIPMRGRIASLNASVAAAILLYEVSRQRSLG